MARTDNLTNFLTDVADAIRTKTGSSDTISAEDFDTAISNIPSGGGDDWSDIGYSSTPKFIIDAHAYSKQLYDNWDVNNPHTFQNYTNLVICPLVDTNNMTNMTNMFNGCSTLKTIPLLNTSNVINVSYMFRECAQLKDLPQLDFSKVTDMYYTFNYCNRLTNDSLNNILGMCANATNYNGTKTLYYIFGNASMSSYYPASIIQTLSNYQDFLDAGWTIGWN